MAEIKNNNDLYKHFDTQSNASTIMGSLLTNAVIPATHINDVDKALAGSETVMAGHRGNKVDIVTANGKILYGTKVDSPDYMSVKYEAGQTFVIFLNGTTPNDLKDTYTTSENIFVAKPIAKTVKQEVAKNTVAINQTDVSLGDGFFDEFSKQKQLNSLSDSFNCPYDPNMSLRSALTYIREPQPGTVSFTPSCKGNSESDVIKHAYADTGSITIDKGGRSEIRSADGASVVTVKDKVYTFGQREYSHADEIRPQQMSGIKSKTLETNDITPKGNVFLPHLPVIPFIDDMIIFFRLGKKLADATGATAELKKLWDKIRD